MMRRLWSRYRRLAPHIFGALSGAILLAFPGGRPAAQARPSPNILFILADDIGYGDVGVYGGRVETPHIDRLAQEGMRFTDAHSPAALCAPSRFSYMTGSNPYRNGRPGGSWNINRSSGFSAGADHLREGRHLTIGEIAQRAGYRTGFFGKMHFGGDVFDARGRVIRKEERLNQMDFSRGIRNGINSHGFDYSFGLASGIQHEPYAFFENGRFLPIDSGLPPTNATTRLYKTGRYRVGAGGISEIVEADRVPARGDIHYDSSTVGQRLVERAMAFIDDHIAANRREGRARPLLLYYASQAIHVPHTPPVAFSGARGKPQSVAGVTGGVTSDMIRELDLQVGALVAKLERTGLLNDTLVIFTSDNGALWPNAVQYGDPRHDNNGPFRGYKASIYEGGHRVPFIARWGDGTISGSRVRPDTVSDTLIVGHDWVATAYEIIGVDMAEDQAMDSASLLSILEGRAAPPLHEFVIYQAGPSHRGAIREGPFVLVVDEHNRATELYDLSRDVAQTRNLVKERGQQERVRRLRAKFLRHNDHDNTTFTEPRTTARYRLR